MRVGGLLQPHRGLVPDRDPGGAPDEPRRVQAALVPDRARPDCSSWPATSSRTTTTTVLRHGAAVPVDRRRASTCRSTRCLFAGILLVDPAPQPGPRPRQPDRLADRRRSASGCCRGCSSSRRTRTTRPSRLAQKLVSMGYPFMDLMLVTGAIRLAVGGGRRSWRSILLLAAVVRVVRDGCDLRLVRAPRRLRQPDGLPRGRMGRVLSAVGRRGAAPRRSQAFSERSTEMKPRLSRIRLVALAVVSLIAPLTGAIIVSRYSTAHASADRRARGHRRLDHAVPARHREDVRPGPAAGAVGRARAGAARGGAGARHGDEPRGDPRAPRSRRPGRWPARAPRSGCCEVDRTAGRTTSSWWPPTARATDVTRSAGSHSTSCRIGSAQRLMDSRRLRRAVPREHDPRAALDPLGRRGVRARGADLHARRVPRHDGGRDGRRDARLRRRQPPGALLAGRARARERGAHRGPAAAGRARRGSPRSSRTPPTSSRSSSRPPDPLRQPVARRVCSDPDPRSSRERASST